MFGGIRGCAAHHVYWRVFILLICGVAHLYEMGDFGHLAPAQIHERWIEQMRCGNWEAAWCLSDEVLRRRRLGLMPPTHSLQRHLQCLWDGGSLAGKRVLVRCYHGLGDTIQFIRFLPALRARVAQTIVWAQPRLVPLLRTAPGIDLLLPLHDGEPGVERDADIELMEVPHALRTTLSSVPSAIPYLKAPMGPPDSPAPDPTSPKVGIVWQSGDWDSRRSIAPETLRRLSVIPGVRWQVMQRSPGPGELSPFGPVPTLGDIREEARALRDLDLLISVDTFCAHLAGALGVPTWMLIHSDPDWRWMRDREDSPWYPTMRLFRQREQGDWGGVLDRVHSALLKGELRQQPRQLVGAA